MTIEREYKAAKKLRQIVESAQGDDLERAQMVVYLHKSQLD